MSRRAQKKAEVREALVAAADELFADRGFEGTTVDDVAERAGVSRRTFFRYFATKEAIAFPQSEYRVEAFRQLLEDALARGPMFEGVREACLTLAKAFTQNREQEVARQKLVDATPTLVAADLQLYQVWVDTLADAVTPKGATTRQRRRAKFFAASTIGAVRSGLRDWVAANGRKNLANLGKEAFEMLAEGFGDLEI